MRLSWCLGIVTAALGLGCVGDVGDSDAVYTNALDLSACMPDERMNAPGDQGPGDCAPGNQCTPPDDGAIDCFSNPPINCTFPRPGCDANGCCLAELLTAHQPEDLDRSAIERNAE